MQNRQGPPKKKFFSKNVSFSIFSASFGVPCFLFSLISEHHVHCIEMKVSLFHENVAATWTCDTYIFLSDSSIGHNKNIILTTMFQYSVLYFNLIIYLIELKFLASEHIHMQFDGMQAAAEASSLLLVIHGCLLHVPSKNVLPLSCRL